MAASCGRRPLCGSRSAADDISDSCSSSLATRAGAAGVAAFGAELVVDRIQAFVELALLLRDAVDVGVELLELAELRLGGGEAIGDVGRNGPLAAIGFERRKALLQRGDLIRTVGGLEAELLGEHVGGEQRDQAAGDAGRNVGEEAAVAARCRARWRGGCGRRRAGRLGVSWRGRRVGLASMQRWPVGGCRG